MNNILLRYFMLIAIYILCFGEAIFASKIEENPPNIILISVESTRADHVSCYGYERQTTPTIDKIAQEGVLFSNMFVPRGITWPSLTSLMTSQYPINHGVRDNGHYLNMSILSLAEILSENGYKCAAFLGNAQDATWRGFSKKAMGDDWFLTVEAVKWIKKNYSQKMFIWIHYFQPHYPFQPIEPFNRIFDPDYEGDMDGSREQLEEVTRKEINLSDQDLNHIIALYDGSIRMVDHLIDVLFQKLRFLNFYDKTMIIITSDHGLDLYQRNYYFYQASSIYDSSLHVPFIIKYPPKIPENMIIPNIVENIDIAPTILEILDIPIPENFEGESLKSLISKNGKSGKFKFAYSEWKDKILSIRSNDYRYIYNPESYHPRFFRTDNNSEKRYFIETEGLYDIQKDPAELNNIAEFNPTMLKKMKKQLFKWRNYKKWETDHSIKEKDREKKEDVKRKLRSLGYVQ